MSTQDGNDVSEANGDEVAVVDNAAETVSQAGQQQQQPTKLESFFAITKSLIIRALIIYFITSFFRRPAPPQTSAPGAPAAAKLPAWNIFPNGTVLDLYVYVSEQETHSDFEEESLVWLKQNIVYGDWFSGENGDGTFTTWQEIKAGEGLRNNGSIYLHVYLVKGGRSPDPRQPWYDGKHTCYLKRMLNKYKRRKLHKTKNLLTGETEQPAADVEKAKTMREEVVSHWHPNLTINLVTDQTNWVQGSVPAPLDEFIQFTGGGAAYRPVLFANDFWNMQRDYRPINESTKRLPLRLTYQPLSLFKWQLYTAQTMRSRWGGGLMGDALAADQDDDDQDTLKEALLDTSPYLLALTVAVSVLHSVFELLAFKNDIQFWSNRKSLEGLSVRSVFFNVFQATVVLLYVLDNDTNLIIRVSCCVGLAIEVWKIHKVIDVRFDRTNALFWGMVPRPTYQDKGSYVRSSTREYDLMAFRYLSWACFPLLAGYACYSLLYNEHKGWYSFVLNMLYGFLLTFGFIMMTPQLFINYKLKSVAHLPWRMMTYKFLNTFIDDIFAFVIKMPTMYRLGCFRDDIVFFVFLYQRWIYKVDVTRVNEFGYSGEMLEEAERKKLQGTEQKAIESPPDKKND